MLANSHSAPPQARVFHSLYRKPKPPHTAPVLIHHALAILLRIIAIGEQHAFVSGRFLVFADTARLAFSSQHALP